MISKIDISFNDTNDISSINVWVPGCKLNCEGCFTPELKDFNAGFDVPLEEIIDKIKERMELTNTVCFIGGNPPDYKDINKLIKAVKDLGVTIWLYSGYEFEEIKDKSWVQYCDYIKAGPYIKEKENKDYRWASTNQKLWKRQDSNKWEVEEQYNV